ncbi:MAG: bifunctional enoyl-CoA hydratase/phosphate acetyltransferase [Bacteroidales bacterium]|nr:bifunctional enoyl-CoA hydratase/phosphate acetyltransferase [Bacteroidales bacterium]
MLKKISELYDRIQAKENIKKLVLAAAADDHSLDAVFSAKSKQIIEPILVGDKNEIRKLCNDNGYDLKNIELIHTSNKSEAVKKSIQLIKSGGADILMKGNVGTATLLKGVLNDEWGLKIGNLLSHFAFFELQNYYKLIGLTDVAMNIAPTLKEKAGIIQNAVNYMLKIGYKEPKVAVIGAVETVNEKMTATIDAAILSKMAQRNQIPDCIIDGPLAFDNAMSKESAKHKKIISEVAGEADLLLMPNIEAGNVLYKSFSYTGGKLAAVILGASAPIVLTSRSDSEESKLNSIVLAAVS